MSRTNKWAVVALISALTASGAAAQEAPVNGIAETPPPAAAPTPELTLEVFLDRLMLSESSGRDFAANPRSTALGPFQFIKSTFMIVVRKHFASETAQLTDEQVLALRTNRAFARRAAEAYTRDNAAYLAGQGLTPTFANLRLAFLVGPAGAVRLLRAPDQTLVSRLLAPAVLQANPHMSGMTAAELAAKAARDISADQKSSLAIAPQRPLPRAAIAVNCKLQLPSCRRWLALQQQKLTMGKGQQRKAAGGARSVPAGGVGGPVRVVDPETEMP